MRCTLKVCVCVCVCVCAEVVITIITGHPRTEHQHIYPQNTNKNLNTP